MEELLKEIEDLTTQLVNFKIKDSEDFYTALELCKRAEMLKEKVENERTK